MWPVTERLALLALTLLTALAVVVAPWAAINRETGARSTVVLLPDRVVDFTGRTAPVELPGQGVVLVFTLLGLATTAIGAALPNRRVRQLLWLAAGVILIAVTLWGVTRFEANVSQARRAAFESEVVKAIANPRPNMDVAKLEALLAAGPEQSLDENLATASAAGLVVRRLPYGNAGFGLTAFLVVVTGGFSLLFGLRLLPGASRVIDRVVRGAAVLWNILATFRSIRFRPFSAPITIPCGIATLATKPPISVSWLPINRFLNTGLMLPPTCPCATTGTAYPANRQ